MKKKIKLICLVLALTALVAAVSLFASGCGSDDDAALADGVYSLAVSLEGGTGRASIASPTRVTVDGDKITAEITWSSGNYDYMIVDGEKYTPVDYADAAEHSRFTIPIAAFDTPIEVRADTAAMSKPHEIDYKITVHLHAVSSSENVSSEETFSSSASGVENVPSFEESTDTLSVIAAESVPEEKWKTFVPEGYTVERKEDNSFAGHFQIETLKDSDGRDGYTLLSLSDGSHFLVVESGSLAKDAGEKIESSGKDCVVLQSPLKHGYLAATAAMAHFVSLDALDSLLYVGATTSEWTIDEAREALGSGALRYAGNYSAPQYEQLLKNRTALAIESTMIYHTPAVKEKLEEMRIPVLVDLSSYEDNPLGRAEWIRVYGVLTGREEEAAKIFNEEKTRAEEIKQEVKESSGNTRKTVAFFYIDSQGRAVVRKSDDYISTMIDMAGGKYIFDDLKSKNPNSRSGSVTLTLEEFYAEAREADVLIYNAAIENPVTSISQLTRKSPTLADFRAVQSGDVWVARSSMYQATDSVAEIVGDLHDILSGEEPTEGFFAKVGS